MTTNYVNKESIRMKFMEQGYITWRDIDALPTVQMSSELCEDPVSRTEIMKLRQPYRNARGYVADEVISVNLIRNLPNVTLKPRLWIPVSERLPEENTTVIASTKHGVYPESMYTKEYGWEWAYESGADYWVELEGVTAWMPLPETYKAESEE